MIGGEGWSGLQNRQNRKPNNNYVTNLANDVKNTIIVARVIDILLDNSNKELFKNLGEWNGLGTIRYETIDKRIQTFSGYAKPLDSNIKKYPLINELVYIITTYNTNEQNNPYSVNSYYINNVALWNHPHHNGYPNNPEKLTPEQSKDYSQTQAGSVRRITDNSTEIYLGKTFKERANVHPLLPFEGDTIYEGRWGNSIRLGSTVKNTSNIWSKDGNNGDAITIIRNGQGSQTNQGWIPVTENINNDESSIYLTSTQNVPLEASSTSYVSYPQGKAPTSPSKYAGSQILLNSGRLVLNSDEDHILLSSIKSVNLNSKESVNIDTTNLSVQADKIYLGKNEANEPLMLGIQTANLLKTLVESLTTFMTIASTATTNICVPGAAATLPTINSAAQNVLDDLFNLTKALGSDPSLKDCNLTSKRNFTV